MCIYYQNSSAHTELGRFLSDPTNVGHKQVHSGTKLTRMEFICRVLELYNSGMSRDMVTAMLLLTKDVLGTIPNNLPENFDQLASEVDKFVVKHQLYKACPNGHCLFDATTTQCSQCQCTSAEGKRLYYIPLLPRLKQLFEVQGYARRLTSPKPYHQDELVDLYDGDVWNQLYNTDGSKFHHDNRALSLIMSSDGMQPFHHVVKQGKISIFY